eukprot:SAG31_NODE_19_length_35031_cov_42.510707_11_plen_161_part_00
MCSMMRSSRARWAPRQRARLQLDLGTVSCVAGLSIRRQDFRTDQDMSISATSQRRLSMAHDSTTTVLDGGMGHQLKAMGVEIKGPVGSQSRFLGVCMANKEQPDLVINAHKAFIMAGADVITTNNYAAVPKTVELAGSMDKEDVQVAPADLTFVLRVQCS